jgi:aminomethyltransferase
VAQVELKQTPLFQQHQDLKARMMGFGGWDMPVQYQGITAEHQSVRQQAGMFDISHMGKFLLQGKALRQQIQPLVPSDLSQLQPGQAKYSVFLNVKGGIVDDLIFYYDGQDQTGLEQGKLIVNAATTEKDKAWLLDHCSEKDLGFKDVSAEQVLIAVQGPAAIAILQALTPTDLSAVGNYRHQSGTILDQPAWFARTGYTGEDGFEVMVTSEVGRQLWETLLDQGVVPCGLGARDTLRLEAAMALYGQDIDDQTTPLEADLKWLLNFEGDFIGRSALEQQKESGGSKRLVGLQMEGRNIARHDYPVCVDDKPVGTVTSGSFSPTLGVAIALAYLPPNLANIGQSVTVAIRGKQCPATVVKRPFYRRPKSAKVRHNNH